jgi:hypothetical protein
MTLSFGKMLCETGSLRLGKGLVYMALSFGKILEEALRLRICRGLFTWLIAGCRSLR